MRMAGNLTELSDGQLVCKLHQLTICGKCCVDYSFMDEVLDRERTESDAPKTLGPGLKDDRPVNQSKKNNKSFSRNKIVKEGWGDRQTFQGSYGLTMTPDDIAEGNEILKAMEKADKQDRFHSRS